MTTEADEAVREGATLDHEALIAGARTLATSLGIDTEPERAQPWPIDVGQRSLMAGFSGPAAGSIYLSIAETDADRLLNDVDGADAVMRELVGTLGVDVAVAETTAFEPANDLPDVHLVVRDGDRVIGFGVSLGEHAGAAGVPASSFEPTPMAPTPGPGAGSLGAPISLLADVDMQVTVELGRTTLPVRELLSLQPGMVVELERQAGSPIDVMVNGRLIARGEVVVLDEQFGLRVTEIVNDVAGGR